MYDDERYDYTGEWWGSYIELLHLRARWYSPSTGTFLSRDPWEGDELRPLTFNGWSYVEGNPSNRIDPLGLCGADWGFGADRRTQECIRLAKLLENTYGIRIYWPERMNLPGDLPDIPCFCEAQDCETIDDLLVDGLVDDSLEYRKWTRNEIMAMAIAIDMYRREIGHPPTRAVLDGVVFVRLDYSPTHFLGFGAQYFPPNIGFDKRPTIALYDIDHVNLAEIWYQFPSRSTWSFVHEIAHQIDWFVDQEGLYGTFEDFRTKVWENKNDNQDNAPTEYARTEDVSEDRADTITTYLWDRHASSWTAPPFITHFFGSSYERSLLGGGDADRDLTQNRIEFTEQLFNALRERYQ